MAIKNSAKTFDSLAAARGATNTPEHHTCTPCVHCQDHSRGACRCLVAGNVKNGRGKGQAWGMGPEGRGLNAEETLPRSSAL